MEEDVKREPVDSEEATAVQSYDRADLPTLLRIYYTWLFPYDAYFQWLQYGNVDTFTHREFSFTLEDDIYVRYQSFDGQEALREALRKSVPHKIDIGAIFSVRPNMRNRVQQANFKAEKKELVFDIDMTDYDDIRTCCQAAEICNSCWRFMTVAIKVLDRALREDFGFEHLLWVYSGRRGVHCWVCDKEAIHLSQDARSAIVEYLTLIKGGEQQVQKVRLKTPLHPSVQSALRVVEQVFPTLLEEQDFLGKPDRWGRMLALAPAKARTSLHDEWMENADKSSLHRWKRLKNDLSKDRPQVIQEIQLQWAYPRLDVNVSKGINHLLKSPLCVHPKTGRVCVPIDIDKLDSFDPFEVPTISQICREFEHLKMEGLEKSHRAYMKTSLGPYMTYFRRKFLIPLIQSVNKEKSKGPTTAF